MDTNDRQTYVNLIVKLRELNHNLVIENEVINRMLKDLHNENISLRKDNNKLNQAITLVGKRVYDDFELIN